VLEKLNKDVLRAIRKSKGVMDGLGRIKNTQGGTITLLLPPMEKVVGNNNATG